MDRKHPEMCKSIYNVSARFAYGPHRNTAASQGRESNWRPRAYSSAKPQPVSHRVGWARSKKPFCQQEWEEGESSLRHAIYTAVIFVATCTRRREKKRKKKTAPKLSFRRCRGARCSRQVACPPSVHSFQDHRNLLYESFIEHSIRLLRRYYGHTHVYVACSFGSIGSRES